MDEETRRKRQTFFTDLENFYRKKWNSPLKTPNLNGRPVDLYRLYTKVTAMGGWAKVSSSNKWNEVAESLKIPAKCFGAEHAVKMIYMRYLARYQHQQMFGEDVDDGNDAGAGGSRSSRGKHYLSSVMPSFFPSGQQQTSRGHQISDLSRLAGGLSQDLIERTPYEKLIRSLQSGLPNETSFALNVCLVMSSNSNNISSSALRSTDISMILDLLLAHVGFFDDGVGSYKILYENSWKKLMGDDKQRFVEFWYDCVNDDEDVKEFLDATIERPSWQWQKGVSQAEREIFNLSQQIDAKNVIANILRNFSFETDFRSSLTSNRTIMKFLLVCINSKYACLQTLGWDTLSNLASDLSLDPFDSLVTQILLRTLNKSLNSSDKFRIIRALETIANLCANEKNETLLCEFLEPSVIRRLIALLAVKDIMMCVHLLECLYSVSEMGQIPCQRIAEQPNAIDTLVNLVTVEAVSFGPSGLMGMKVVEFGMPQPHTAILPQPFRSTGASSLTTTTTTAPPPSTSHPAAATVTSSPLKSVSTSLSSNVPPPFMAKPVRPPVAITLLNSSSSATQPVAVTPSSQVLTKPVPPNNISNFNPTTTTSPIVVPIQPKHKKGGGGSSKKSTAAAAKETTTNLIGTNLITVKQSTSPTPSSFRGPAVLVQQDQHAELAASNWLKQNCFVNPSCSMPRADLYAAYVTLVGKTVGNMAVSINTFTTLIRQNFPSCQLRQMSSNANCKSPTWVVEGLKYSPAATTTTSATCVLLPSTITIPPTTTDSKSPVMNTTNAIQQQNNDTNSSSSVVVSQHPLTQQILAQKSPFSPSPTSPSYSGGGGANSPAVRSFISSCRGRSDSIGTADSYSLPATPDSIASSAATNCSTSGVGCLLNLKSSPPSSPRPLQTAPVVVKKSKPKKKKNVVNTTAEVVCSPTTSTTAVVEYSSSSLSSSGNNNTATNCQLEVCHPAQEAQTVIETGDNHEALILRIENNNQNNSSKPTTAKKKRTPSTTKRNKQTQPQLEQKQQPPPINGRLDSDTSPENSRHSSTTTDVAQINNNNNSIIVSLLNKKPVEKQILNLNGLIKPTTTTIVVRCQQEQTTTNNGPTSSNSRTQSPSPDMEAMKQNLQQQQENIQQLLMTEPKNESTTSSTTTIIERLSTIDDDILDSVNAVVSETFEQRRLNELARGQQGLTTTPTKKKAPAKKKSKKKSTTTNEEEVVINFDTSMESESSTSLTSTPTTTTTAKKPAKKKPSKRKSTDQQTTTLIVNGEICATPPTKKSKTNHNAAATTTANHLLTTSPPAVAGLIGGQQSFRPPLPPAHPNAPVHYLATIQQQGGATAQIVVRMPPPQPAAPKLKYMCEWDGCDKTFDTCSMVSFHVAKAHILSDRSVTMCKWHHCDKTPRLTWSLIAHVQDIHCNERVLITSARRRYELAISGQTNIAEPKSPPPHPGYPPDAAVAAIRRHALVGLPKDVTEENEGPVTKSIRLASSLTLRNLARYSSEGRRVLRKYERTLSWLSMSRLESGIALAQCLAELYSPTSSPQPDNETLTTTIATLTEEESNLLPSSSAR